jgi:hypothetical protein
VITFLWLLVPVAFIGEKHKLMLGNCKKLLDKGVIAINPDVHKDLIQELRLASADEDMSLDKSRICTLSYQGKEIYNRINIIVITLFCIAFLGWFLLLYP